MLSRIELVILWSLLSIFYKIHSQVNLHIWEQNERFGFINDSGEVTIEPLFHMAFDFLPCGIAAVVDDTGWVYIDKKGARVIRPFVFDNGPDYFSENLARFEENGKMGFFNTCGERVIKPRFFYVKPFSEGLGAVCLNGMKIGIGEHWIIEEGSWGFIDKTGRIVIPVIYENADSFKNGRARVQKNGTWIQVDKEGNVINEPRILR